MSSWVLVCPHLPLHATESSFRGDTKCRGRVWHRLLLQLPQMKALFSTTKPYITHTGPASLAISWLFLHSRTYVCSPSSEQEDHILQLSPWVPRKQPPLCEPDVLSTLHTTNTSPHCQYSPHLCMLFMLFPGEIWNFFSSHLRHHHLNTAFPSFLKGLSSLCPTTLCWHSLFAM